MLASTGRLGALRDMTACSTHLILERLEARKKTTLLHALHFQVPNLFKLTWKEISLVDLGLSSATRTIYFFLMDTSPDMLLKSSTAKKTESKNPKK